MEKDLSKIRTSYQGEHLDASNVKKYPVEQFRLWMEDAIYAGTDEFTAMSLATASRSGVPSVRTVLLKDLDEDGFSFYTNYNSKKAKEIAENPHASLLFFWPRLFRQVRIDGVLSQIDPSISEEYFRSRPRESQITAWISPQSNVIENKMDLEQKYKDFEMQLGEKEVPFPAFWGGYCLKPHSFEFWQGQPNRLHDRIQYTFNSEDNNWTIARLAP
jgi:pyridoxamine 5'-phosphate oxidase